VVLPALATQADVANWGYTLPSDTADALLDRASVRLRRAAGEPITASTVTVQADVDRGVVLLPAPPVISVSDVQAVASDGTLSALTGWWWNGEHLVMPQPLPVPCVSRVQATYLRGWATVPEGVVELTCQVAVRLSLTPAGMDVGIRQRTVDDYTEVYAVEQLDAAGNLLSGEMAALRDALSLRDVWVTVS
jgi:hypothetical protein